MSDDHQLKLGSGLLTPDRLAAANISPATGLATDYLNHFHEVAMLLEIAGEDEVCSQEVLAWAPVSYPRHFEHSGFRDKALAMLAYQAASPEVRVVLELACARIEGEVAAAQTLIRAKRLDAEIAHALAQSLFSRISAVAAVIAGAMAAADQAAVDDLLATR